MEKLTKEELLVVKKYLEGKLEVLNRDLEDEKENLLMVVIEEGQDERRINYRKLQLSYLLREKREIKYDLERIKRQLTPENERQDECCGIRY